MPYCTEEAAPNEMPVLLGAEQKIDSISRERLDWLPMADCVCLSVYDGYAEPLPGAVREINMTCAGKKGVTRRLAFALKRDTARRCWAAHLREAGQGWERTGMRIQDED